MLRTACGAQNQRADQKTVRHENGDDTLVGIKFKAADVIIPSDAFGELEERGMIVAMDPHGFETGNQTTKLAGRNLNSKNPNSAYGTSLTRWEDRAKTVALVDLKDVKRSRHERTHVEQMNWCSSCVAGRASRKSWVHHIQHDEPHSPQSAGETPAENSCGAFAGGESRDHWCQGESRQNTERGIAHTEARD